MLYPCIIYVATDVGLGLDVPLSHRQCQIHASLDPGGPD